MSEISKCIYGRTSVRKYKGDKVPDEDIKEILKAGVHAATGMNCQPLRFVIIQNRETIKDLSRRCVDALVANAKANNSMNPMIEKMEKDPDMDLFYGAPTLIFNFADPSAVTPVEDGSLAAGNMMLAAYSMGYGTCFIGFAAPLAKDKQFRKECKVPDNFTYLSCLCLGRPDGQQEPRPRSEAKILHWIR